MEVIDTDKTSRLQLYRMSYDHKNLNSLGSNEIKNVYKLKKVESLTIVLAIDNDSCAVATTTDW
jgi:hypothetical protein